VKEKGNGVVGYGDAGLGRERAEEDQKGKKAVGCMDEMGCLRDDLHATACRAGVAIRYLSRLFSAVAWEHFGCWGVHSGWCLEISVVVGFIGWGCCASLP
jgi:hypothetical protein